MLTNMTKILMGHCLHDTSLSAQGRVPSKVGGQVWTLTHDEDQSTAGAAQHIGQGTLEESLGTLVAVDFAPRIQSAVVLAGDLAARLQPKRRCLAAGAKPGWMCGNRTSTT